MCDVTKRAHFRINRGQIRAGEKAPALHAPSRNLAEVRARCKEDTVPRARKTQAG